MILQNSRYEKVTIYSDTGVQFLGTRIPVSMVLSDDDTYLTYRDQERVDQFAVRAWAGEIGADAAARLWWVLLDINDQINPFAIPAGKSLRVPTAARVALEVLADI